MQYDPVVGLEIHAHLLTRSKMFCACDASFGAPANRHVCPVCLGLPGALPVLNRVAVDRAVGAALALGCTIHQTSVFARKNYFYPDLPKGYQISQYEQPMATQGLVSLERDGSSRAVRIRRVHLEEDAGKLLHQDGGDARFSFVDHNRAGAPLMEIVTEPDLGSGEEAAHLFERVRELLMAIGVSDGNMEEGSLRCDANVSVRRPDQDALGTKVEIKNLNSFRFLERAIDAEVLRQRLVLESGEAVVQETRLWDQAAGRTVSMRSKEESHDYRYFPEPDLLPLTTSPERVQAIKAALPELPQARRARLLAAWQLSPEDAAWHVDAGTDAYFEEVAAASGNARAASNWVKGPLRAEMNSSGLGVSEVRSRVPPTELARLIQATEAGTIGTNAAKGVLATMFATARPADAIIQAEGLTQVEDEPGTRAMVADVLRQHASAVDQYRKGKTSALGFLVGQVMKAASGKANPKRVSELLRQELDRT